MLYQKFYTRTLTR
uniref:Uncharacterized protein n=1 Tax=Rhizophora mucronata TaxID=61149 RepID=A0A2P2N9F4_RHIMU